MILDWLDPEHGMQMQIFLMPNWKWVSLLSYLVAAPILQKILARWVLVVLKRVQESWKNNEYLRFLLDQHVQKPLAWIFILLFGLGVFESLALPSKLQAGLNIFIVFAISVNAIVLSYKGTEALGLFLDRWAVKSSNALNAQLAPFLTKSLKVIVVVFGFLLTLQSLGVNVASLLAGIGIGSLALALAAQDTAANLFGSIMIILDRPFQVGDLIRVADTEGTVEDVGFRSTRIRTAGNSLVTIPNSTMAKEKIDNLGARSQRRIRHVLGLEYGTSQEKIHLYMDKVRYWLSSHSQIQADSIVKFYQLGDFSLQILVVFHTPVKTIEEELQIQQEFLFEAYQAAQAVGVAFAFPTQTVVVQNPNSSLASVADPSPKMY